MLSGSWGSRTDWLLAIGYSPSVKAPCSSSRPRCFPGRPFGCGKKPELCVTMFLLARGLGTSEKVLHSLPLVSADPAKVDSRRNSFGWG